VKDIAKWVWSLIETFWGEERKRYIGMTEMAFALRKDVVKIGVLSISVIDFSYEIPWNLEM